ncbi:MAG: tRNA dihydrouridine synthase DusB [bacterium]|nr:tRNA dihydrouridine synthase DusB [bacterium]
MRLGCIDLESNVLLAPMAGYCDLGFRVAVRGLGGVGLAHTDLLSSHGMAAGECKTLRLMRTCREDHPLSVQLFGGDAAIMAQAARMAVDHGAEVIDINMGCPVEKVTKRNGGAAWLCDPCGAVRLAEAVVRSVEVPVTVKVRLGPDENHLVAPMMAGMFAEAGVAALTVHGRTTAQRFGGQVNLEGITEVVAAAGGLPVFGNGDIKTPHDAATMIARTGCSGVMIGRGALREPWLIRDTSVYLHTGQIPPPPSLEERVALMMRHFERLLEDVGERRACHVMRQRIGWYAKTLGPCRALKEQMRRVRTETELRGYIAEFLDDGMLCAKAPGSQTKAVD